MTLIAILDDHSYYFSGSQNMHEQAKPRKILTDHGIHFSSVREGESSLEAYDLGRARFQSHRKFIERHNHGRSQVALDCCTAPGVYFRKYG